VKIETLEPGPRFYKSAQLRVRPTFYECGDFGRARRLQDGPSVLISNSVVDLGLSEQEQD
jgi:hypothetical protein